jgi:hypothetical protein
MTLDDLRFEVYVGTFFDVSVYTEYLLGFPYNHIFRNANYPDREYVVPFNNQTEVLGTFFNTNVSFIAGTDNEPGTFTFVRSRAPAPLPIFAPNPNTTLNHEAQTSHIDTHLYHIGTFFQEHTSFILSFIAIGLTIYLTFRFLIRNIKKRRDRKDWESKLAEVKADARKARINRGYNSDRFN